MQGIAKFKDTNNTNHISVPNFRCFWFVFVSYAHSLSHLTNFVNNILAKIILKFENICYIMWKRGEIMSKNLFFNSLSDMLILSILEKHDSYMYEIVKSVTDFSGGLLNISQNTIYTAAYKLENEGKISEYSKLVGRKRTRVYYHLEPKGREHLAELLQNYKCTTEGIQNLLTVLAGIETAPSYVKEVDGASEQAVQEVYVGSEDAISDKEKTGAGIPKNPCFSY
ncbi:MAG: helix-turn-helix transcriptional regulator [Ruminococcaceae bacterium]|nr:helix-turn-helix transcriptional regulator [Oscillospiraceae bacterium]